MQIKDGLMAVRLSIRIGSSPHESLDGGAHHAGEQEQRRDQDVEERQRGEGHGRRQVGVLGDVDVDHERLQGGEKQRSRQRWGGGRLQRAAGGSADTFYTLRAPSFTHQEAETKAPGSISEDILLLITGGSRLTVSTARMGMAAFMKTETRREKGEPEDGISLKKELRVHMGKRA